VTSTKRALIIFNPRSGKGRGTRVEQEIRSELEAAGHSVTVVIIDNLSELDQFDASDLDALIAVGGDGTVHAALGFAMRTGAPLYHAPLGTENLFSREFGMSPDPVRVCRAVEKGSTRRIDLALYDGTPFAIMCGLGFDANVIQTLHAVRKGSISHLSYTIPILRELRAMRRVCVSVEVDGEPVVERGIGQLVIANSKQYAMRNDYALNASMTDGLTDLVFLPCTTGLGLLIWSIRARTRRHLSHARAVHRTGRTLRVSSHSDGSAVQIDGEFVRTLDEGESLVITTAPSAMAVLLPA